MAPSHILPLGILTLAAACTSGDEVVALDGAGDHQPADPKIYGGDYPDAVYHDAVVGLHNTFKRGKRIYVYTQPFCTGTLITDDVVLTAAHCLDAGGGKAMSPSKLLIYVGDDPWYDLSSHLYDVVETAIHPDYNSSAIRNDVALVRLAVGVTTAEGIDPVANLPADEGFTSSDVGTTMNFAGFGENDLGITTYPKLQVDLPLGGLGCTVSGCPGAGDAATQVSYSQGGGGPCFGDSGGPMFVTRGSTTYVGGITSYGDSYCTIYGVSTRVDAYEDYILSFTGGGDTGGGDTGLSGCDGDGVCEAGESCDGRYGTTACGDCDGKTTGKPSGRYCYVEGICEGAGCP